MAKEQKNETLEKDSIGEFIRSELRNKERNIQDSEVRRFFNMTQPTLSRLYLSEDMYMSKLVDFCVFLDEDVIREFYYSKEPLKRFKEREERVWLDKIADYEKEIKTLKKLQEKLEDHINTQKVLIEHLKKGK